MRNLCINYSLSELEIDSANTFKPMKKIRVNNFHLDPEPVVNDIRNVKSLLRSMKHNVAQIYGIRVEDIDKRGRKKELVEIRQCLHYCLYFGTRLSLSNIGYEVGKKDHATVLHSKNTVENHLDTEQSFRNMFKIIYEPFIDELKKCAR